MSWIRQIGLDEATGLLKRQFDAALRRAGRVWNITRLMSLEPNILRASMGLYRATMFHDSELSRGQREMVAVVVSRANHCTY